MVLFVFSHLINLLNHKDNTSQIFWISQKLSTSCYTIHEKIISLSENNSNLNEKTNFNNKTQKIEAPKKSDDDFDFLQDGEFFDEENLEKVWLRDTINFSDQFELIFQVLSNFSQKNYLKVYEQIKEKMSKNESTDFNFFEQFFQFLSLKKNLKVSGLTFNSYFFLLFEILNSVRLETENFYFKNENQSYGLKETIEFMKSLFEVKDNYFINEDNKKSHYFFDKFENSFYVFILNWMQKNLISQSDDKFEKEIFSKLICEMIKNKFVDIKNVFNFCFIPFVNHVASTYFIQKEKVIHIFNSFENILQIFLNLSEKNFFYNLLDSEQKNLMVFLVCRLISLKYYFSQKLDEENLNFYLLFLRNIEFSENISLFSFFSFSFLPPQVISFLFPKYKDSINSKSLFFSENQFSSSTNNEQHIFSNLSSQTFLPNHSVDIHFKNLEENQVNKESNTKFHSYFENLNHKNSFFFSFCLSLLASNDPKEMMRSLIGEYIKEFLRQEKSTNISIFINFIEKMIAFTSSLTIFNQNQYISILKNKLFGFKEFNSISSQLFNALSTLFKNIFESEFFKNESHSFKQTVEHFLNIQIAENCNILENFSVLLHFSLENLEFTQFKEITFQFFEFLIDCFNNFVHQRFQEINYFEILLNTNFYHSENSSSHSKITSSNVNQKTFFLLLFVEKFLSIFSQKMVFEEKFLKKNLHLNFIGLLNTNFLSRFEFSNEIIHKICSILKKIQIISQNFSFNEVFEKDFLEHLSSHSFLKSQYKNLLSFYFPFLFQLKLEYDLKIELPSTSNTNQIYGHLFDDFNNEFLNPNSFQATHSKYKNSYRKYAVESSLQIHF